MNRHFDAMGVIKNILGFILVTAVAFGWMLLVLMLISFVALSYITLKLSTMLIASGGFAAIAGIGYIVRKIKKMRG